MTRSRVVGDATFDVTAIDWRRIARPQADQYDTDVALWFAGRKGYVRSGPGRAPTFFDGAIAIYNDGTPFAPGTRPAPPDHPNIARACDLVRLWPESFVQCQRLIDRVAVFVEVGHGPDEVVGSICHTGPHGFGSIASTVDNHAGFAEALVHEMAHHKLRALGLEVESAERLVINSPEKLYRSPIRHDVLRPMTAVLHAQYSYTYITALDVAIIEAEMDPPRDRRIAEWSLATNLLKIEFGREVIARDMQVDDAGSDFIAGLFEWLDELCERGHALLHRLGVSPVPFQHPQDTLPTSADQAVALLADESLLEQALGCPRVCPQRRGDIEAHPLRDEMVLYCAKMNDAFALNPTSRAIWELCDGERTLVGIVQTLAQRLDCRDVTVMRELLSDVWTTVEQLHGMGLLSLDRATAEHPE